MKKQVKKKLEAKTIKVEPARCIAECRSGEIGGRCKNKPIPGGRVCLQHGGRLPSVRRSAAMRLALLIDPSIDVLQRELDRQKKSNKPASMTVVRIAQDMLDRNGLKTPDDSVGATPVNYSMYTDEEILQLEQLALKQRLSGPGGDSEGEG